MVSKYELVRKIGGGGHGEVFLGYRHGEHETRRPVAIKRIRRDRMDEEQALRRFIREAQVGTLLEHPNILAVQDFHRTQEGDLLLVMDFVRGWSVAEILLLQQGGRLPIAAAVHIIKEVLCGLAFVHQHGIVHRDIKPENILIAGQTGAVLIADLGLAHLRSQSRQDQGTYPCGTIPYAAPEQLRGTGIDARTDLFSVGVTFYQLLTGKLPFLRAEKFEQALAQVLFARIAAPMSVNSAVPPALEHLVMRMLERDAADRYASADQVLNALEELELLDEVMRDGKEALMDVLAELNKPVLHPGPDGAAVAEMRRLTVIGNPKQLTQPPQPQLEAGLELDIDEGELSLTSQQRPRQGHRYLLAAVCGLALAGLGWSAAHMVISRPAAATQHNATDPVPTTPKPGEPLHLPLGLESPVQCMPEQPPTPQAHHAKPARAKELYDWWAPSRSRRLTKLEPISKL